MTRTADPVGGSYFLESLTDELEERAATLLNEIEADGVITKIEDGSLERAIADAAYRQHAAISTGDRVVVGENQFRSDNADEQDVELLSVPGAVRDRQVERLERLRAERDSQAVETALAAVKRTAEGSENTVPAILEAVRALATVGEISAALADVFGYHRPSTVT